MLTVSGRARALDLVTRHARSSESGILRYDAPWRYVFGTAVEGVVPYLEAHDTAVVWCDPVCAPGDEAELLEEFTATVRSEALRVCLLLVEEATAKAALAQGYAVVRVGEEAVFDLGAWRFPRGNRGKSLRWCLNRAGREGVEVLEYRPADARDDALEREIADVVDAWERSLARPPAQTLLRTSPLLHHEDKALFVARSSGRIEAVLGCSPVPAAHGWYLEDTVRLPDSATGATELLVVAALDSLAGAGAAVASLGVAPGIATNGQIDRRARALLAGLRPLVAWVDARYRFRAMSLYKEKFRPTSWRPRYVAVLPPRPSIRLARAVRQFLA